MIGITIPNFVMAPLLDARLRRLLALAAGRRLGGGVCRNLILPVIALALPQIAYIARLTRGSMIEVLRTQLTSAPRAPRACPTQIVLRHALQPALLPVVSYLGPGDRRHHHRLGRDRADLRHARASAAISCKARSIATTRW